MSINISRISLFRKYENPTDNILSLESGSSIDDNGFSQIATAGLDNGNNTDDHMIALVEGGFWGLTHHDEEGKEYVRTILTASKESTLSSSLSSEISCMDSDHYLWSR